MTPYQRLPKWYRDEITNGVQLLFDLRLSGSPAQDRVHITAMSMAVVISRWPIEWDRELDAPRLLEMFLRAAGAFTRWPAPGELRQHLPPRPRPLALPEPVVSIDLAELDKQMAEIFTSSTEGKA